MESSLFTVTSLRATKEREKWSDEEEEFLKKMERQCDVYYNHHTGDFKYYHRLASKFNIPILIISSINALTAVAMNELDRKSTRLNSSHVKRSRMPSSA